jgi:hypothetical protein
MGLKPNKNLIQAARFLMRNHFQLSRPLMDMVQQLLPNGPWENHGPAEALIAALSRLPLDEVPAGFRVLLTAFTSKHPTVMTLMHHVVGQLQDLISTLLVQPETGLPTEALISAFKEELAQWQAMLNLPKVQIAFLLKKRTLLNDLRRMHLFFQTTSRVLLAKGANPSSKVLLQLATLQQEMRHGIDLVLGDMILSRDDRDHHFKEEGHCSTLGLWSEGEKLPARMWAEGDEEEGDAKEPAWWFRFHWNNESLGRLEAQIEAVGFDGECQFSHDDASIREAFDEHREILAARLRGIGFEIDLLPANVIAPEPLDPEAELHSNQSGPLLHIDSEA